MCCSLSCHFEIPYVRVAMMRLGSFRSFIAKIFNVRPNTIDIYSLGHKLEDDKAQMSRMSYVVPGALLEIRTRGDVQNESPGARD